MFKKKSNSKVVEEQLSHQVIKLVLVLQRQFISTANPFFFCLHFHFSLVVRGVDQFPAQAQMPPKDHPDFACQIEESVIQKHLYFSQDPVCGWIL